MQIASQLSQQNATTGTSYRTGKFFQRTELGDYPNDHSSKVCTKP